MLLATNQTYNLEIAGIRLRRSIIMREDASSRQTADRRLSFSGMIASNNRVNHIVRFVYFLNAAIILAGLGYITAIQKNGLYRCNSISVVFDEEIWEKALVKLPDGNSETRLLIYSNFNGVYNGKPVMRFICTSTEF